jgi:hypothetical protein
MTSVIAVTSIQPRWSSKPVVGTKRAISRSARRGCSISASNAPRRHSVASPRASALAVTDPPSPARMRAASRFQMSRRSWNRYGVAAATAASTHGSSSGAATTACS